MEKSRWTGASQEQTTGTREEGWGWGGYSISGSAALVIYHSASLGKRKQLAIDCTPPPNPTRPATTYPSHVGCCLQNCSKHQAKFAHDDILMLQHQHNCSFNTLCCYCTTKYEQGNTESLILVTVFACLA